jgi:hypothetical protein
MHILGITRLCRRGKGIITLIIWRSTGIWRGRGIYLPRNSGWRIIGLVKLVRHWRSKRRDFRILRLLWRLLSLAIVFKVRIFQLLDDTRRDLRHDFG